jgi:hypothetical protein
MPFSGRNLGTFPGENTRWGYRTTDDLVEVCKTGYFQHAEMRLGDRIEVSAKGGAQATLAVITPGKDGRIKTFVLGAYDPLDSLDRLPAKQRPEKKMAPTDEPAEAAA